MSVRVANAVQTFPTQIGFNARGNGRFNKPFNEQVEFFRQKLNLPTEFYDDILKQAHDRAFVVAGAQKADLLDDLRKIVDKSIVEGKSIGWFRKEFDNIVKQRGWEGWTGSDSKAGRDWRTRIIYRTNIASSYAAGRWQQLNNPALLQTRPYWKYIHNDTVTHPRPLHVSWSGLVLRHDDPFWQTHFPPNGWGCRCRITAVREKEFKGEAAPDDGLVSDTNRPQGIDKGWDYAPGAHREILFKSLIEQKLINTSPSLGAEMWQTLKPVLQAEQARAVKTLVTTSVVSMKPVGDAVVAHVISADTVMALKNTGINLEDSAIWLRDSDLIHAIRDKKTARSASLPIAVWENLTGYLDTAEVYLDSKDNALVYAFDVPTETGKVIIRLNRLEKIRDNGKRKKIVSNFIASGGIIKASNLGAGNYIKLDKP
ncbi:MAG: hypothetical protein GQ532_18590 [Methylomarinum sp.]|nr:hypothetical protein [Methylomarinum sp.]